MAYASERLDITKFREMLAKLSDNPSLNEREKLLIQMVLICLDAAIIKEFY